MHSNSNLFHPNDFSKTVLSWTFATLAAPLEEAMRQAPLPRRERNISQYYANFRPLILEEARAIIASGLEAVEQYNVLSSRKGKKNLAHLSDAKPFNLVLQKKAKLPKNEGNPLFMSFRGRIPEKIEHGKSMNVLLLKTKNITPEKQFIALATENPNATELSVKIIIDSSDFDAYDVCFSEGREWQAHYLGSVISEQRMYDACLEETDIPCVQQIARGKILAPQVNPVSAGREDIRHLNLSQREAIYGFLNARSDSTLLLQGPPGTGKTTTLVNLLKQVASLGKRTMVSAHSNKAVQVLALRAIDDVPNVRMIVVGVESKLPEKLKPIFLNRWYDIIQSNFSTYHDEVELLEKGRFNEVQVPIADIVSQITTNIDSAQQALNQFMLLESRRLSSEERRTLLKLSNDPMSASDFQVFQSHIDNVTRQPRVKEQWAALLVVLNRLIEKWSRIKKEELESHLLNTADIVFATLITSGRKSMLNMAPIDFLLVDEAAQSVEAATLIPMRFKPSKVLLVGDTKQLPATVISRELDDSSGRSSKNYKWSMMWRLIEELNQHSLMLTIQYRMHPHICQWPSGQYYEDKLITSPNILPMSLLSNTNITSRPYAFYQISGQAENQNGSTSICNSTEAKYVVQIIEHIRRQNETESIGVITPYAAQKRLINEGLLKKKHLQALVDVNTVDGFQGDERDIIIISFTRTHVSEFLKEFRRLNVAITRPKACLIILGAPSLSSNDIGKLVEDARSRKVLYSEQDLKNILASGVAPATTSQLSPQDQFNHAKNFEASNWKKMFLWKRRAAENNHAEAQYDISQIYFSGNEFIKKDTQLGIRWLWKAAQQGFPLAQYVLGKHYISGEIIAKDVEVGIDYCDKAAEGGVLDAIIFLAKCYDEGLHVVRNSKKAENYYRRAAKLEDLPSILRLAELLAQGSSDNQREAIKWYRKAAQKNVVAVYYPLAKLLSDVLNDEVEALVWYIKAAENGHIETQYQLGLWFKYGYHGCVIDVVKSAHFFKLAAIAGHLQAQFMYAMYLKEENGASRDGAESARYFKKSADQGHAESQYQFALWLSASDKSAAYSYYKKAALQHHASAQFECVQYQIQFNCDLSLCLSFCEQLIIAGNLQVQFVLARLLDTGLAGKTDKARAYGYYSQLANDKHILAQYYCAVMLEDGVSLTGAQQYYELCVSHYPKAKLGLARILLQKYDVKRHEIRAINLLKSYCIDVSQESVAGLSILDRQVEHLVAPKSVDKVIEIKSIDTGSIYANYSLGLAFKEGQWIAKNISVSMGFFKKAASCGHVESQYEFALLTSPASKYAAYSYFKKAALQNHALAQHECIRYQLENNHDLAICLSFCEYLAASNNIQVQFLLARLLDTGIAGKVDKVQAYNLYVSLANNGHHLAQYHCAIMLEQGVDVKQDLTAARRYYEACQEQRLDVKLRLACLLLIENETQSIRQPTQVEQEVSGFFCVPNRREPNFFSATPVGSALTEEQRRAIALLDDYYSHYKNEKPAAPSTLEQHLERLILAAAKVNNNLVYKLQNIRTSSAQANYLLGKILQEGKGVIVDIQRVLHHYELARSEYPDASYRMGYIHESGQGVAKSWANAKVFYQNAADRGHELAKKRLTWAYSVHAWSSVPDDATLQKAEANCLIM